MKVEHRWVPVTESGERLKPRSEAEADLLLELMPAGSTYSDGAPIDGVTHVIHQQRLVTEWEQFPP